ncbi:hypothetical protein SK128_015939 [Halocaridina rubra]|uniref:DUF3456 domain-containing protein n=1 Tax=Halocaridina rubra TaxID=373956 RepID=A0AAN8WG19_HALRR
MKTELVWILVTLFISVNGEDADHIDTDADNDDEAALKCDACKIVASKFAEYFQEAQGKLRLTTSLKDEDIIEAAEATCDDSWEGYGVTIVSDQERLVGPGSDVPLAKEIESDAVWPRRLQDMCDELLGETPDEKTLYNIWASGSSLTDYLCKGEGLFGACSSSDWGPWPGDEYDDYDDAGDFDYIHDEF